MSTTIGNGNTGETIGNAYLTGGVGLIPGVNDFVNGLTNGPASYQQAPMDPGSSTQIANSQNQLSNSPAQNQANILEGTGAASSIQNQAGNQTAETAEQGGGGINGMTSAIGNRNAKNFATSQNKLSQAAQIQGMQMTNQNMNMAAQTSMALSKAQEGITSQSNALNIAANAARYNTISQLMGGAGSFGGQMLGGKSGADGGTGIGSNGTMDETMNSSYDPNFLNGTTSQETGMGIGGSESEGIAGNGGLMEAL